MAAKKNKKAAPAKKAAPKKNISKKPAAKKVVAKKPVKKAKPAKVVKAVKPAAKPAKPAKPAKSAPVKPVAKVVAKPEPKVEAPKPVSQNPPRKRAPKNEPKRVGVKPPPPMKKVIPPPLAPASKTPAKIIVPSRIIKKQPVAVNQSPENLELIKRTTEAKKLHAEAEAKKQAEAALLKTAMEKRPLEKKPMVIKPKVEAPPEDEKKFYTKEELEEFRGIINEKMTEARTEYSQLLESLQETNELSADGYNMTEFGSDTIDKEQTEMFLARQKKFIQALERALVRIENGTYGRCKVTGRLIPKERLRLVPHTESSIQAKQQQYDRTGSMTSLLEEN